MEHNYFLWLDLETSGLDPRNGFTVEVAAVITDIDMEVMDTYTAYVRHWDSDGAVEYLKTEESFVYNMHTTTGLLDMWVAANKSGLALELNQIDNDICEMLVDRDPLTVLAGSSVHFDRNWLTLRLPKLYAKLHHRELDTSSLKMALNIYGQKNFSDKFRDDQGQKHLAMDDIMNDIRWMKNYKTFLQPFIG